ncbi:MAG TPA: hypothetical protein VK550_25555 [Polyangiaceae bacterium]|jgi:hypothetical protein|nr:hypothetical protein [Polyangiaceae bacterium]
MKLAAVASLRERFADWFPPESRRRRVLLGVLIYVVCTGIFFAFARRDLLTEHTKANHFALLADSWLHRRLDLGHPPPAYTQNNDFAEFNGKWFISFPPFPALILLPMLAIAKTPENLRDGQIWLWLAGLGPAILFFVLEKLRRMGESERTELQNLAFAWTFSFGTVYFFTAEQGTVWFAAHIVAVALAGVYLLCALGAERPIVAGAALGCAFLTRPDLLPAGLIFFLEAIRTSRSEERKFDWGALIKKLSLFAIPIAIALAVTIWHNRARFGGGLLHFGHENLTVGWRGRIDKWGLFSYHYLPRNLGIFTSSLPYMLKQTPWFQINTHGLALWFTTPLYLCLFWPRKTSTVFRNLVAGTVPVVIMLLLYQNSGWLQFGYRFSNDYAVFLFAMLAIAGPRFGPALYALVAWGVAVNTFGAVTFDRGGFQQFYYTDNSQQIIFQPD